MSKQNDPARHIFRGVQYPDYKTYRQERDRIERDEREAQRKADTARLRPAAAQFKKELVELCVRHGVELSYTSDDSSDWYGVTGFELGFNFKKEGVFFPLED